MKSTTFVTLVSLTLAIALEPSAEAQMFGSRTLGTSRTSSRATADTRNVGTVQGNERFVRGNRGKGDFVGADSRDSRNFVGSEQGTGAGRVRSAVSDLRIERSPDANRIATSSSRSNRMYEPRLAVGFRHGQRQPEQLGSMLQARLASSDSIQRTLPIEVLVEGPMVTLRGEVASEHDRRLAELLVLFEPGISQVRNELRVRQQPPQPAAPPAPAAVDPPSSGK